VGRRPGLPAPEPPSLELCPSAGVDSWPGLTVSAGVSPRQGHHLSLAPKAANGKHKPPRRAMQDQLHSKTSNTCKSADATQADRPGRVHAGVMCTLIDQAR
ncbi:MAG TPA: hypothetical protein PLH19_16400, partial [Anaerolineae bacterium]|nr:hypothetical protein [Anaerolineae bacterium]